MKRKRNFKNNYIIFFLFLGIFCLISISFLYIKQPKDNFELIFESNDSETLNVEIAELNEGIYYIVEKHRKYNICELNETFQLLIDNKNKLNLITRKYCPELNSEIVCGYRSIPVEININRYGNLLVEAKVLNDINELEKYLTEYNNDEDYYLYKNGINIDYSLLTPIDSLKKLFLNIKSGYVNVLNEEAANRFKVKFNDLSTEKVDSLKKVVNYNVSLNEASFRTSEPPPIPPPPPPIPKFIDNNESDDDIGIEVEI